MKYSVQDIRDARVRIGALLHVTPVMTSTLLDRAVGARLALKCEHLQKTGSFKSRGALNAVILLDAEQRRHGVVTASAGNHAQALAWAAAAQGISCTVVMPSTASQSKIAASEGYGATVVFESGPAAAFERAAAIAATEGRAFVHPFDDAGIVSGAGTLGLELADQLPDVRTFVVPVGGGGLVAGIAIAIKAVIPDARVIGVEPEGASALRQSLTAGHAVTLQQPPSTIADGLAAPMAGRIPYEVARDLLDDVILVPDSAIMDAMKLIISRTKQLVEPSGAAATAAILSGGIVPRNDELIAVILSGGNVDLSRLA